MVVREETGRKGLSLSLIATSELRRIVRWKRCFVRQCKRNIPSGTEIVQRQILHRLQKVDESHVPAIVFDKLGPILQEKCETMLPERNCVSIAYHDAR